MTWRTHLAGGIASLWTLRLIPGASLPDAAIFAAIGSLLPDLDAASSKIQALCPPLRSVSRMARQLVSHRGPFHSLIGAYAFAMLLCLPVAAVAGPSSAIGLLLGYLSHLLLDACTVSGLPLLWPDPKSHRLLPRRLKVVTNGPWEDFLLVLLALPCFLLFLPL